MSEAKFTPAPWVIIKQDDYEAIDNDELGLNICTFTSRVDDTLHDKNLIASAPEMYELLDEVSHVLGHELNPTNKTYIKAIKELLAKARGEKC